MYIPQWLLNSSDVLLLWCDAEGKHLQLSLYFISGHWIFLLFCSEMDFRAQCGTLKMKVAAVLHWAVGFVFLPAPKIASAQRLFSPALWQGAHSAVQLLLWCCVSVPSSASWSCEEPKWKPNLTLENLSFPLLLNSGQQCVASKILKVRGRLKNWKPEATPLMPV